ncbi:RNA-directed DNA polymerase from mobile element jockey-like [Rhizophagus irregularis DAOM 181602=DAOM 197198]|nr:RNA-directed DNA polymerase from mobile element jockey-like [Rhizophagus irregularis DAOM 181602=DAOM 197198]
MLKGFALTSYIFDAQDTCSSDHNPIITYFDDSLLVASIKVARAKQLQRQTRRIFKFDSVTAQQWESFSTCTDSLCNVSSFHLFQHGTSINNVNIYIPPSSAFDTFIAKISFHIYNRYERTWSVISFDFKRFFLYKKSISNTLHGFLLLKEKDFQDSSIQLDAVSLWIVSLLITLRIPNFLTDPLDIDNAVINHFQNSVPIKSTPPINISALPERWSSAYRPMDDVDSSIYNSFIGSSYSGRMHLGPNTSALILILVQSCLRTADIPDLWRQAMVFPIPKPHEWKCQLKNTRPITLLEVIRKSLVKLFYNRLASILASNEVLRGGNFAGLPGGSCRDPIVVFESIIHDAHVNKSPLWILSQDISKAFDSVDLKMLRFALERIKLPASATKFILSLS